MIVLGEYNIRKLAEKMSNRAEMRNYIPMGRIAFLFGVCYTYAGQI